MQIQDKLKDILSVEYTVTHQVVTNLPLTSKQNSCFWPGQSWPGQAKTELLF